MIDAALDLFLGSSCAGCAQPGRSLCRPCERTLPDGGRVTMPSPAPDGLAQVMSAGDYDGVLKALVNAHKERRRLALARPLGRVLAGAVAEVVPTGPVALVPVPSSRAVVRRRGHDPLLRVTRAAAAHLRSSGREASVVQLLRVVRRTADQSGLDASARLTNLHGSMRARTAARDAVVVVVDDVVTTGSTAREAQRALEASGTRIAGVAAIAATRRRSLPIHSLDD